MVTRVQIAFAAACTIIIQFTDMEQVHRHSRPTSFTAMGSSVVASEEDKTSRTDVEEQRRK